MTIETRLQALEKRAAQALPVYAVKFDDGSSTRMDALDLLLCFADLESNKGGTKGITEITYIQGTMPAGSAWDSLTEKLQQIRQKGGTDEETSI